jgi:hypothetical protein
MSNTRTKKQKFACRITLRISICPTTLEQGSEGDMLDPKLILNEIERVAARLWPRCKIRFAALQIGHRQNDEFAQAWEDGVRSDDLAETLLASIDFSSERLYLKN